MTSTRWALITGVSPSGLGDALTGEFLSRRINVIATAPDLSLLDHLPSLPGRLEKLQLDVTDTQSIAQAVERVRALTNGLDFLVNNAGYGYMMPLLDAPLADVRRNYEVNVFGLLAVTQAFFPLLREAHGMVVNQSSIAGLAAGCQPFIGTYSSSKAAVTAMGEAMRMEFRPFGVKVVTLITGDVRTTFWQNASNISVGLPEASLYAPIRTQVEAMMRGHTNPPGQHSREDWARRVVGDLLKRNPSRYVRRGFLAVAIWLVSMIAPSWLIEWGHMQNSHLNKMKPR